MVEYQSILTRFLLKLKKKLYTRQIPVTLEKNKIHKNHFSHEFCAVAPKSILFLR
jgi:hypothetical protein